MTTYHFCIGLDKLLELTLKGTYGSILCNDDGSPVAERDVYRLVREQIALGRTYFTGCDYVDCEGRCAGHKDKVLEVTK